MLIVFNFNNHYPGAADCYIYFRRKTIHFVTVLKLLCHILEKTKLKYNYACLLKN